MMQRESIQMYGTLRLRQTRMASRKVAGTSSNRIPMRYWFSVLLVVRIGHFDRGPQQWLRVAYDAKEGGLGKSSLFTSRGGIASLPTSMILEGRRVGEPSGTMSPLNVS